MTPKQDRAALSAPSAEVIFEREADGMAAWIYRFGADTETTTPDPAGTGGQYLVVVTGEPTELWKEVILSCNYDDIDDLFPQYQQTMRIVKQLINMYFYEE